MLFCYCALIISIKRNHNIIADILTRMPFRCIPISWVKPNSRSLDSPTSWGGAELEGIANRGRVNPLKRFPAFDYVIHQKKKLDFKIMFSMLKSPSPTHTRPPPEMVRLAAHIFFQSTTMLKTHSTINQRKRVLPLLPMPSLFSRQCIRLNIFSCFMIGFGWEEMWVYWSLGAFTRRKGFSEARKWIQFDFIVFF